MKKQKQTFFLVKHLEADIDLCFEADIEKNRSRDLPFRSRDLQKTEADIFFSEAFKSRD